MRVIVEGGETENLAEVARFIQQCLQMTGDECEVTHHVTPNQEKSFQWAEHLEYDHNVSTVHPIIKGTWVTAGEIVSLIVDGNSWKQILHMHPELDEDDIRACMLYMTEEEDRK